MSRLFIAAMQFLAALALSLHSPLSNPLADKFGLAAPAQPTDSLDIVAVDPAEYPAVDVTVMVRDQYGQTVSGLDATDFSVEEAGRVIPGEALTISVARDLPAPITLGVVADMSSLIDQSALNAIRNDVRTLVEQVAADTSVAVEIGLFVPRSGETGGDQTILVSPWSVDQSNIENSLATISPRKGQTDLYNSVVMAINASAQRAAERGGPAYVVVLGDGKDRTSIVGAGATGPNEAARLAEERSVRVHTLKYGRNKKEDDRSLAQLADRTNGSYAIDPNPQAINELSQRLLAGASNGGYRLRYTSSLPADGNTHELRVRANLGGALIVASDHFLLPRRWDQATPARLDLQLNATNYPQVTLLARPVNNVRRTVAGLTTQDVRIEMNGAPLDVPFELAPSPLAAEDPSASQSVALVVAAGDQSVTRLNQQAVTFLHTKDFAASQAALFVPGMPASSASFTHDHNALINALEQARTNQAGGKSTSLLLLAIDAAARDGETAQRPAYVVWFADTPLAPDEEAQVLSLAQQRAVTIHIVGTSNSQGQFERIARLTGGAALVDAEEAALQGLATQIGQDRAAAYRVRFEAPFVADGQTRSLELTVANARAQAPLTAIIPGASVPQPTSPYPWQGLLFAVVALTIGAGVALPRWLHDRRNRCKVCGTVRREGWGATCLFCEAASTIQASDHALPELLAGFTAQGEFLAQATNAPEGRAADLEPAPAQAGLAPSEAEKLSEKATKLRRQRRRGAMIATHLPRFVGFVPLPEVAQTTAEAKLPGPAVLGPGAQVALDTGRAGTPEVAEVDQPLPPMIPSARVSQPQEPAALVYSPFVHDRPAHTDFWGPLPESKEQQAVSAVGPDGELASRLDDDTIDTSFWGPKVKGSANGPK